MKKSPFQFSFAEELGKQAAQRQQSDHEHYKDWDDFAKKRFGFLASDFARSGAASQRENVDWFDPHPKVWEDYAEPADPEIGYSNDYPFGLSNFAARLGWKAGAKAASQSNQNNTNTWEGQDGSWYGEDLKWPAGHASLEFNPHASFEDFLDTVSKYAPKTSADGRIPYEMKPESAWTKPMYDWNKSNEQTPNYDEDLLGKYLRRGVNTLHYAGDVADDWFYRGTTYAGKKLGYLTGKGIAKATGMNPTDWEYDELNGSIHKRVPIEGRGYKAYLEACERGEDPSKWYAHAEDADYLHDWNPDNMVSAVAKGAIITLLNASSPSQLAKGYLLKGLNNKLVKIPKSIDNQLKVDKTLQAVEPYADMIFQKMK